MPQLVSSLLLIITKIALCITACAYPFFPAYTQNCATTQAEKDGYLVFETGDYVNKCVLGGIRCAAQAKGSPDSTQFGAVRVIDVDQPARWMAELFAPSYDINTGLGFTLKTSDGLTLPIAQDNINQID